MVNNNRDQTIFYLLVTSGVVIFVGCQIHERMNRPQNVIYYDSEQKCTADAIARTNGLTPEQCRAQFQYALQEYDRITPLYRTEQECKDDTASICIQVPATGSSPGGWRPEFGGTYFSRDSDRTVNYWYGGGYHRVYWTQPVYRSYSKVVTPAGVQISSPRVGVPLESRYFSRSTSAPPRPTGYAAKGTIKGRGSFGGSVRFTAPRGSGGK
jgi:uncharacterized protein YgiB involved in biofilm formation